MLFILDENAPLPLARAITSLGFVCERLADELVGTGFTDEEVVRYANDLGERAQLEVMIVTYDRRDFKKLASRRPPHGYCEFRRVGSLWLNCNNKRVTQRLEVHAEVIHAAIVSAKRHSDRRVFLELRNDALFVHR